MPGLFPNPSASPETFRPGDQVRWYVGDAHISPYVGVVTQVHPGIQKVDVEFPVGGNQRMSPEDLILVTRFMGEAPLRGDWGYDSYDRARSDDGYGTLKQNLRQMAQRVVSKKASQDGKPMASVIAEKFAAEVIDELASDVVERKGKGMSDVGAYQDLYPKYASKCSDAFLRGAVRKIYAATKVGQWTVNNTELKEWSERDRNSVVLEDKRTGNSIMEWWDEDVHQAVEDGFLTMGKGKDRLHQDAVDYANERQMKPRPSAFWHKAFQDAEKARREEHEEAPVSERSAASQLFDAQGNFTGKIPKEAVRDCSGPGKADEAVEAWRKKLNFEVPRDKAIRYLKEFGAWPLEELNEMDDDDIAKKVLWIACGDIKENGKWLGLVH